MSLILKAAEFARRHHEGVKRRVTGEDYIQHPARVAGRVATLPFADESLVAAAFLHDVLEDEDVQGNRVTAPELEAEFGPAVTEYVQALTNPSKGSKAPRRVRKQMDRDHLAQQGIEVRAIKLLDRIDNLREMRGDDPQFVDLYVLESLKLVEAISRGLDGLADECRRVCRSLTDRVSE